MRTTIDIPDETYRTIKVLAAERGTTVRELVLEGMELVRHRAAAGRQAIRSTGHPIQAAWNAAPDQRADR